MSWKTAYRSFYYAGAEEPEDIVLPPAETAHLCIDIQNYYLQHEDPQEARRWAPFVDRMHRTVIPGTARLIAECRSRGVENVYARIACLKPDGRDRSLSQKKPGFNYLLLPKDEHDSQIVPELAPRDGDVTFTKTTDSAVTGTNMRLVLQNMGIGNVVVSGIFTDQCVSSTVRTLADESFNVVVVEGLLRGGDDGAAREGARDHQHDLLPRGDPGRGIELLHGMTHTSAGGLRAAGVVILIAAPMAGGVHRDALFASCPPGRPPAACTRGIPPHGRVADDHEGSAVHGHRPRSARHRSALVRVPGLGRRRRIEYRAGDNAANPFLYVCALMAAGLDGIRYEMELPPPVDLDAGHLSPAEARALEENEFDPLTGKLSYSSAPEGHYPAKAAALVALSKGQPSFPGRRRPEKLLFKESRTGLLLRAVRDNEAAAEATGAHVSVLRWRGFVPSALTAGLGGALWGHFITSTMPSTWLRRICGPASRSATPGRCSTAASTASSRRA